MAIARAFFNRLVDILRAHAAIGQQANRAPAVDRRGVAARDADKRPADVVAAALFGFMHRRRNRRAQLRDVGDRALAHPPARLDAQADDENLVRANLADDGADFRCPYINPNNQIIHSRD
ncbi:MAG: hypothetical protein U0703_10900 [Anaerolineae bacterium]